MTYMNNLDSYIKLKKYFELFISKVMSISSYAFIDKNSKNEEDRVKILTEKELCINFKHLDSIDRYNDSGKMLKFIDVWIRDPEMKIYDDVIFYPYNKDIDEPKFKNVLNLFKGYNKNCFKHKFTLEQVEKKIAPWLDVILNICEGDEKNKDFFIKFLAHIIQRPRENPRVGIVLTGNQGTMKNVSIDIFSNLLNEEQFYCSENLDNFFGSHAIAFENKLISVMDELDFQTGLSFEKNLKVAITQKKTTINQKYLKQYEIDFYSRLIALSNKINPFPLDFSSRERRICVFRSTDKYLSYPSKWITQFIKYCNTSEFTSALYTYLMSINIDDYSFSENRPLTLSYKEMWRNGLPPLHKFMNEFIEMELYKEENREMFLETLKTSEIMEEKYNVDDAVFEVKGSIIYRFFTDIWCPYYRYNKDKTKTMTYGSFYQQIKQQYKGIEITHKKGQSILRINPKKIKTFMLEMGWIISDKPYEMKKIIPDYSIFDN